MEIDGGTLDDTEKQTVKKRKGRKPNLTILNEQIQEKIGRLQKTLLAMPSELVFDLECRLFVNSNSNNTSETVNHHIRELITKDLTKIDVKRRAIKERAQDALVTCTTSIPY